MKNVNWETYKFHPSGLGNLLTNSRKKDELLSETAKSYLRELWIKEVWSREKSDMVGNKFTQKGIMAETDSLNLIEKVTGQKYFKNQKQFENDFIIGTPDVTGANLIDVKTSWDLFTFMAVTEEQARKDYYSQVLGYMWLLNHKKATVMYCLVNTPEILITDEMYRLSFKLPEDQTEKYRNNYIFDDIPENQRIKVFNFDYDEAIINTIKERIVCAREYLKNVSLGNPFKRFEICVEVKEKKGNVVTKAELKEISIKNVPADWGTKK